MSFLKYISFTLIFILLVICYSCNKEEIVTPPDPNEMEGNMDDPDSTEVVVPPETISYLDGDSDYIFDHDKLLTFELKLSEEDLNKINDDPAAEEYVEGSLIFEGDTITPVGIRYKGSIGAFVNCVSGNNWADPSGYKTCTKLSMKIKINWEGSDARFFGLKKLQFHSMNLDDSQMRDRLGYWLFREMGVKAPRCVHARLLINGEYNGLFALVEQIDGRFTRYNWDDGEGNLYKEIWPLDSEGDVQSNNEFLSSLKTNEDENPSVDIIRTFAEEAQSANEDELKSVIDKWMDTDAIMSHVVVDRMIRHDDGPFHWYCDGSSCSPHNFYWYEEVDAQKIHLIPWDLDNAFENIDGTNPVTNIADDWGESSNNCQPFSNSFFGLQQLSASCDQIVKAWTLFDEEFESKKDILINGPLSRSVIESQIEKWSTQISDATIEAQTLHNDAITVNTWNSNLDRLKNQLEIARNN